METNPTPGSGSGAKDAMLTDAIDRAFSAGIEFATAQRDNAWAEKRKDDIAGWVKEDHPHSADVAALVRAAMELADRGWGWGFTSIEEVERLRDALAKFPDPQPGKEG